MKKTGNYHVFILLLIILLGIILRLYNFQATPFTHDELSVVSRLSFDTFSDLINYGVKVDTHPAGIQVFLWLWSKLFGMSEIALRLPFLIMGICCIPLMYVVTKLWANKTAALFTATIVATSQYTIFYSLIIRPYTAGLFFILLLLIPWIKMVFKQEYHWKNVIAFGIFAAISAYIHQFSMLTAFLIAVTGLFFVNRQNIFRYLMGCLLAIILYLPHIPIILHQISHKGIGEWLGAPTPRFFTEYLQYLIHFSWISAIGIIVAIIYASQYRRELFTLQKNKLIVSALLFFLPLLIGYFYSIWINPILQYSILIFSFPFLLLFLCSFINDTLSIGKGVAIALIAITMTYGLVFDRKHYQFMEKQWYEISYKKAVEYRQQKGNDNVACMLNIKPLFFDYYENKYKSKIDNLINRNTDNLINRNEECLDYCFEEKIQRCNEEYLVVAGLGDNELIIIQEYFPYLIEYIPCFTSEVYVFSKIKEDNAKEGMPLIYHEEFIFDENTDMFQEFIPIKEFFLKDITPSRFSKIVLSFDFETDSANTNYAVVMETMRNGKLIDWRGLNTSGFRLKKDNQYSISLPFRYELLIKNSKQISQYHSKIYLWNIDKNEIVTPKKCSLSIFQSNNYIYSLVERLK